MVIVQATRFDPTSCDLYITSLVLYPLGNGATPNIKRTYMITCFLKALFWSGKVAINKETALPCANLMEDDELHPQGILTRVGAKIIGEKLVSS